MAIGIKLSNFRLEGLLQNTGRQASKHRSNRNPHHYLLSPPSPPLPSVSPLPHSPDLTWRDMQHLSVLTSKRNQLHDEVHQWRRNGVGLEFNHLFGYGVLDAGGMVKMSREWKTVPERSHCVAGSILDNQ